MTTSSERPLRSSSRLIWLAAEFAFAAICYPSRCWFRRGSRKAAARSTWLQYHARRVLRMMRVEVEISGRPPARGLVVSNHLSYLDVIVLAAQAPSVFVAKLDVKRWPVMGWFASLAGSVFVNRERRTQAAAAVEQIDALLAGGMTVVLFPEGTSSDGRTVLPFKSALLEPAACRPEHLTAACIAYQLDDGDAGEEVCYWKDMTFAPHLFHLLGKGPIHATVRYAAFREGLADRKELATRLRAAVLKLKAPDSPHTPAGNTVPALSSGAAALHP